MLAIEADSKPNRTKIAILLSVIGPDALGRYNHFKWDDSPNDPPNNPMMMTTNMVTPNLLKTMPLKPMTIVTMFTLTLSNDLNLNSLGKSASYS